MQNDARTCGLKRLLFFMFKKRNAVHRAGAGIVEPTRKIFLLAASLFGGVSQLRCGYRCAFAQEAQLPFFTMVATVNQVRS